MTATLNHLLLDHFLAAYEARSLGKAAALLGLSQPALSKSVRKLEAELGLPLFERTTSGLVPTLYAETLSRRGQAIRADLHSCIAELQKLKHGEIGEVRMGVAPALSPRFLPLAIAATHARHPSLTFAVREGLYDSLAQDVVDGELDFALTNLPFDRLAAGLEARELFRDRFVVCCGAAHPLARKGNVQAADLLAYPWITPPRDGMVWHRLVDLFAAAKALPPRAAIETTSAALIMSLLGEGRFLTFVPRQLVLAEQLRGEVIELTSAGMVLERAIAVVSRTGREYPMAARLALEACEAVALQMQQAPKP
ncbi:LysR family transcriptional regulator [Variovorax terrae]|uniref:LysR family transcriptional regulator n=1 Tax=Variovorax terrae TaxID=2923278 RepID=A0A9X1VTJ9_9BURK|nr:LysR family transcriptional regulator [Variovorax terrae]MCJ0763601.1 LysR family transcriptional regulator [Variovorax terrae]